MTTIPRILRMLAIMMVIGLLALTGCNPAEADAEPEAVSTPEIEVPTAVINARDVAIDFVRQAAAISVPPAGTPWHASKPAKETTAGATVYRFINGDSTVSVAYPDPEPDDVVYYISLRNAADGFCWQAFVAGDGEILGTGYDAVAAEAVNPAVNYCEAQGFTYDIITKADGEPCGACVFDDGTACNAWDYLYGTCGPGENLLPLP